MPRGVSCAPNDEYTMCRVVLWIWPLVILLVRCTGVNSNHLFSIAHSSHAVLFANYLAQQQTPPLWQTCAFLKAQPTHGTLQVVSKWAGPDNNLDTLPSHIWWVFDTTCHVHGYYFIKCVGVKKAEGDTCVQVISNALTLACASMWMMHIYTDHYITQSEVLQTSDLVTKTICWNNWSLLRLPLPSTGRMPLLKSSPSKKTILLSVSFRWDILVETDLSGLPLRCGACTSA